MQLALLELPAQWAQLVYKAFKELQGRLALPEPQVQRVRLVVPEQLVQQGYKVYRALLVQQVQRAL